MKGCQNRQGFGFMKLGSKDDRTYVEPFINIETNLELCY
jgi:hypothetical protein